MRREAFAVLLVLLAVVTLAIVVVSAPGSANPPSCAVNPNPMRCRTPSPTPTTPTPTPTTPTPTITPPACGEPIVITTGGTYSGCYQSTSNSVPAVTLATAEPVTLDHARIIAKGFGVQGTVTGTQLTITDTVFEQTDPGAVVGHRAVSLEYPASFVAEHNSFTDGDGILLNGSGQVDPLTVRYNYAKNIGRYQHPQAGNCCVQFLQLGFETTASGVIAWNHAENISGQSGVGDVINLYHSGGADSTHKIDIANNLIDGAYPATGFDSGSGTGTTYVGGGIVAPDYNGVTGGTGGHSNVHDNTVVSTTNYAVSCGGGTDCHLYDNLAVNDRFGSDGVTRYDSDFGQAYTFLASPTASSLTSGSYNWLRNDTDGQQGCWPSAFCTGLVQVSTSEQEARDMWEAARVAAGVTIGPQ